ncbi:MAG TPA: S-layer homology domain-containing protein [Acidimicrobiia bacterium]|nr:S-layer homology domain-containing protein [Acidimicrobiia bacterium]
MKRRVLTLLAGMVMLAGAALPAGALAVRGAFIDDDTSVHESAIDAIAAQGIAKGCNPPTNNRFCPNDNVTRGQMAAFLARAEELSPTGVDFFSDDGSSIFEGDINRLAAAEITRGCNPPTNSRFCPDDTVTRGQMAAFLARALDLAGTNQDFFVDDNNSTFEGDINRIARAGITLGCNPPANDRFCPDRNITRAEMATFLARAYELAGVVRVLPLNHVDYNCAKNGLTCSANVTVSAQARYRLTEGWYQVLPYLGNEESVFTGGSTRFELRVDGQLVGVTHLGVTESGNVATRRWRAELTLRADQTIQGRWYWNGVLVRTTTARLVSG